MTDAPAAAASDAAPAGGGAEFVAVALLTLAAEAGLAAFALGHATIPGGAVTALAGHIAVSVLLAGWLRSRARRDLDLRMPGLLAVTTPVLGPAGATAVLFSALCHRVFHRYATGFQDWYLSLFPESETAPAQELFELIVSGREQANVAASESFTDVMTVGTPAQKQAVIALVSRHFRPAFTPALKLGLADADPSVRVQAATATARVEHEFNERWLALEEAVRESPDDPARCGTLSRHLDAYAFCGLLDTNREAELREKALAGYRQALDLAPDDGTLRHDLGRLLLRLGHVDEAERTLRPLIAEQVERGVLVWYAECLFRLGRFDDLRDLCRRHAAAMGGGSGVPDALGSVVDLWAGIDMAPGPAPGPAA